MIDGCEITRIIGYLRPCIGGKSFQSQLDKLKASGATKIYQEQTVGAKRDRPLLDMMMADVLNGDTVVVTSLDRIAHNSRNLLEIVESLNTLGVTLKVIDNGIDTSAAQGQVIRQLLGAITDFERQIIRERQSEGIDMAKRQGRYKGRKPTAMAKKTEVLELNAQGLTRQKIADQLGIGVASVYRILKNHTTQKKTRKNKLEKPVDKPIRIQSKPTRKSDAKQLSLFDWDVQE